MKFKKIFESSFAIELAKDLAEQQQTLSPDKIIKKLIQFAVIGVVALVVAITVILMIRSSPGADSNTRQVLVFTSLVAFLVLISAIGATLVTLWDGFVGQYIQRLSLLDVEQMAEEITYEIPIVNSAGQLPGVSFDEAESDINVIVAVEDEEFVHDGDLSVAMVANRLEGLRCVMSNDDWLTYGFDEHMKFFDGLNRDVTVGGNLSTLGTTVLATIIPMLSSPGLIVKYDMHGQISGMLTDVEESIDCDDVEEVSDSTNQVAIG